MAGFYAMQRGWMDNAIFGLPAKEPLCRRAAWAWLVEHAAYQATDARVEGKVVVLARGELSVSIRDIGGQWGWATTKVARFVSELYQHRFIGTRKIGRQFVISICDYDTFSYHETADNRTAGTMLERPWNDIPVDARAVSKPLKETSKQVEEKPSLTGGQKEASPIEGDAGGAGKGTRLPRDFMMPLDWIEDGAAARVKSNLPPVDLATEAVKFANYWIAKTGREGTKRDWKRTWLNWCLNAKGHTDARKRIDPITGWYAGFNAALGGDGPPDSGIDCQADGPLLGRRYAS